MKKIIADQNIVFIDSDTSYQIDCSELLDDNVVFAGVDGAEKWVERSPFTGRIADYDFTVVDQLIDEAKQCHAEASEPLGETEKLQRWRETAKVSRFQARHQLRKAELRDRVEAIVNSDDVDPLIFDAWLDAQEFRRNSHVVKTLAGELGLSAEYVDELFRQAALIEA